MRKKANIECESCGYSGHVTYSDEEFQRVDIAFCPVCGSDVSEVEDDLDD